MVRIDDKLDKFRAMLAKMAVQTSTIANAITALRAIGDWLMTPAEFLAYRRRLGWSLSTLARKLGVGASRLADYEAGHTRGQNRRLAPIPKVVELALKWLEFEEHSKTDSHDEWRALMRKMRAEAARLPAEPPQRRRLSAVPPKAGGSAGSL
jgi:transcriptional regulator with XRE-family HTH domain